MCSFHRKLTYMNLLGLIVDVKAIISISWNFYFLQRFIFGEKNIT